MQALFDPGDPRDAAPPPPGPAGGGWQARLELAFESRGERTVLAHNRHLGPLVVQRPFHPEGAPCHVYLVHPPGGVVAGDDIRLQARVGPGAHALVTTPAAGKFYRSAGAGAVLHQELEVAAGTLEWLPQENIYYPGARVRVATVLRLAAGARLIAWEISSFGLAARGEAFETGEVRQCLDVQLDAKCLLCERQVFDAEAVAARWGLAGRAAVGTLVALPADAAALEAARAVAPQDVELGATLVEGLLVCRARAARADRLRQAFVAVWRALRPGLAGREAVAPRVWAT
jgi:urease accessory protein